MTYRRAPGSFHAAMSAAVRALGREALAGAAGVSASRLDQMMNPMRRDLAVIAHCVAIDAASAGAGHGTPILDAYLRRLAAGARACPSPRAPFPGPQRLGEPVLAERGRRLALEGAVRAFLAALRRALEGLESALAQQPGLRGAA